MVSYGDAVLRQFCPPLLLHHLLVAGFALCILANEDECRVWLIFALGHLFFDLACHPFALTFCCQIVVIELFDRFSGAVVQPLDQGSCQQALVKFIVLSHEFQI